MTDTELVEEALKRIAKNGRLIVDREFYINGVRAPLGNWTMTHLGVNK